MKQKLLVTGGAGFIGSHLVELLLREGYAVRVLDSLVYGRREWVDEQAEFLHGDVRNHTDCERAAEGCSAVFHMAAMSRSAASLDQIHVCTESNIVGTQNMLAAAKAAGAGKFVYSGSSTYYGSQAAPHHEEMRGQFLNFYGLTKYVGEEYSLMYDRMYGLPTVVLRYFNVYGMRQPTEGIYALVLGIFLKLAAEGKTLTIHGTGEQRRDFIHVRDVAAANLAALRSPVRGEVFNVGSGENLSVQELANFISPDQAYGPRRTADAEVTLADMTKTRGVLGWSPAVSFAEGLAELHASQGLRNLADTLASLRHAAVESAALQEK
jgi:nucleoside-diphosphate-sugar epimerase